jgi:hypothetical protein
MNIGIILSEISTMHYLVMLVIMLMKLFGKILSPFQLQDGVEVENL